MSLIHWWPLRNSLADIAGDTPLSPGTAGGSYSFTNTGKLGMCVSLVSQNLNVANPFIGLEDWSISFWCRDDGVADWGDIICWYANFSRIEVYSSGGNWHWYNGQPSGWYDLTTGNVFSPVAIQSGTTRSIWRHIAITKSGTNAKLYLDGVLKLNQNNAVTFTSGSDKMYFNSRAVMGGHSGSLSLSDVKAYDHELSQAEIEELSRGLMVHYTFQNHDNVFNVKEYLKSNVNTGSLSAYGTTGFTFSSTGGDPYTNNYTSYLGTAAGGHVIMFPVKEGKTYTLSWQQVSGVELDKNLYSYYNASKTCVGKSAYTLFTMTSKGSWRYTQFTVPTGYGITQMGIRVGSTSLTSGKSTTLDNLMLTTYSGEDYQFFGSGDIVNEAGYKCDAVLYNGFYSSDTASGTCSCHTPRLLASENNGTPSPSNSSYIVGDLGYEFTPQEFTVAFWWKPIDWGYGAGPIAIARSISDYLGGTLHSHDSAIFINFNDGETYTRKGLYFTGCPLNEWSHFAVTYKRGTMTTYINGVQKEQAAISTLELDPWRYIFLGAAGAGGVIRDGDIYWSDFRYYSTCLSGDDIKDLYQTKAVISDKGDIMCGQFIENRTTAQVTAKYNFEIGSCDETYLSDYIPLDYIESSGQQYIDTGIHVGNQMILDAAVTNPSGWVITQYNYGLRTSGTTIVHYTQNQNLQAAGVIQSGKRIQVYLTNTSLVANGVTGVSHVDNDNPSGNVTLFSQGTNYSSSSGRIHYCNIYKGDELVRSLIPVKRISDSAVGMYDTTNRVLYTSQTATPFIAGPVIEGNALIYEDQRISGRNIIEI